jgi:prolyl oligopeptidase
VTGFLTPPSLHVGEIGKSAPRPLKSTPAYFDTANLVVSQHEATSQRRHEDPVLRGAPRRRPLDGTTPTLLYAYGGFEVSMTPGYNALVGAAWLEQGGTYVLANIRGGGEFGPSGTRPRSRSTARAATRTSPPSRAISSRARSRATAHLGVMGGSNGGLMVGNMITLYPELFGAAVCQVPLLDMRRYHELLAGASWMGEYGDPDDPAQWSYIRGFSPYHNVKAGVDLSAHALHDLDQGRPRASRPRAQDGRAHGGAGHDVLYYENIEGGHGGAADNGQRRSWRRSRTGSCGASSAGRGLSPADSWSPRLRRRDWPHLQPFATCESSLTK